MSVDQFLINPDFADEYFEGGTPGNVIDTTHTTFNNVTNSYANAYFSIFGYAGQGCNAWGQTYTFGNDVGMGGWNVLPSSGQAYSQIANFQSYPPRNVIIARMQTSASAAIADLVLQTNGYLQIVNNSSVGLVTSNKPVPLNKWVMINFTVFPDPSKGYAKIDIFYSPTEAVPDDTSSMNNLAIPGGSPGKAWFGLETRFAVTWNAEAITNLSSSVAVASSLAVFQANGFTYTDTNFGHNQTIPNPASATFTSTHTKSVDWGVELHTIPYAYGASPAPSINYINTYNQFAEIPQGVNIGTYTGASATSHTCTVTGGGSLANCGIFVAVAMGGFGASSATVTDSAGNVYTQVGSLNLDGYTNVPLLVFQANQPSKALISGTSTVTVTPNAATPCNFSITYVYNLTAMVTLRDSEHATSASISTATGALPSIAQTVLTFIYSGGAGGTPAFGSNTTFVSNTQGQGVGLVTVGFQTNTGSGSVATTATLPSGSAAWCAMTFSATTVVVTGHFNIQQAVASRYVYIMVCTSGAVSGSPVIADNHGNAYSQIAFIALPTGQRVFLMQSNAAVTFAINDWYTITSGYAINGWSEVFSMIGLTATATVYDDTGTSATPTVPNVTIGTGNHAVLWIGGNDTEAEVVPVGFTHLNPGSGSGGTGGYAGVYAGLGVAYYADRTGTMVINPDWIYDDFNAAIVYTGNWGNTQNGQNLTPPATWYGGTQHFSNITGNYATLNFNMPMSGSLYVQFSVDTNRGIGSISIDGGTAVLIDTYSSTLHNNFIVWESPVLARGSHTIVITVTGTKNAASSAYYVGIDAFSNMPIVSGYGTIPSGDSSLVNIVSTNVATSGSFSVTDTQGNAYTLVMSNTAPGNVVSQFVFACLSPKALGASDTISVTCTTYFEGYASAYGMQGLYSLLATAPGGSVTSNTVDMKVSVSNSWAPVLISATVAVIGSVPSPNGLWTAIDNLAMSGTLAGTISQNLSFNVMSNGMPTNWGYYFDNCSVKLFTSVPAPPDQTVWVDVLNTNFVSQGMIQFATVTATLYYNAVGTWTILAPYSDWLWKIATGGDFIVRVNWRNMFEFGGKCEQPGYVDSMPGSTGAGSGPSGSYSGPFIMLTGGDYLQILANRICYPDPTSDWAHQRPSNKDIVVNVPLETAIKHYVSVNAGPGALSARRHPSLVIATDQGRGPAVNYSVQFTSGVDLGLLDVIRALIAQAYPTNVAGGMGFRITRTGTNLTFDVFTPVDKSQTAYFSEQLGNLTSINFSLTDPTCTDALVQGVNRFVSQTNSAVTPWTKTEVYVDDTSNADAKTLTTTAQNELFSGTFGPTMGVTASDTPFCIYGRDYVLGDIVTVEVRTTPTLISYTDVVSSVQLTADPSQSPILNVIPTIGNSTDPTSSGKTLTNQLTARIKKLEKNMRAKGR